MQDWESLIATLTQLTHHHLSPMCLQVSVNEQTAEAGTSSMALSAILSILMESHEDAGTTTLIRTLTTKTLNLAI